MRDFDIKPGTTGWGEATPSKGQQALSFALIAENLRLFQQADRIWDTATNHTAYCGVEATFEVKENLPRPLRQGLFSRPGIYGAFVRFSGGPRRKGSQPDPLGMAVKLLNVPGPRVMGRGNGARAMDLVLRDHEIFTNASLRRFLSLSDILDDGAHPDPYGNRAAKAAVLGTGLNLWKTLTGNDAPHRAGRLDTPRSTYPLRAEYSSGTPHLLGELAVKFRIAPDRISHPPDCDCSLGAADGLAKRLMGDLRGTPRRFDVMVQVQQDPATQPIEDPSVNWSAEGAPWTRVARIEVCPLADHDKAARARVIGRGNAVRFNPWNILPAHRPIGAINRVRREVYQALAAARHDSGGWLVN